MPSKDLSEEQGALHKQKRGKVTPSQITLNRTPTKQSQETRSKVIQAAIKCINEEGFQRANTNRIAKQAGLTWGVLQYHFGDKEGILGAVLDSTFEQYVMQLKDVFNAGGNVSDKISRLTQGIWDLVSQPSYLAALEIIQNVGRDPNSGIDSSQLLHFWATEIGELWQNLFPEDQYDAANSAAARHILFATLRGLAGNKLLRMPEPADGYQAEFTALNKAIEFLLLSRQSV